MTLSISEFSEMCNLPPQTLRFYHSEGLLVPAEVDEQTGYRSYAFEQIERAMMVTVLRDTGMSVKLVRRALDEPDMSFELLQQHVAEIHRLRQRQDEAISDAREFFAVTPEARRVEVPEMTVVSKLVPGSHAPDNRYDWQQADDATNATVAEILQAVESCGATVSGPAWRTWAMETAEQREGLRSMDGPHWLVKVPVTGDDRQLDELPDDLEVQTFEAREELSIFMPGKSSMAKFGTALSRLVTNQLETAYIDVTTIRQVLHEDGVETSAMLCKLDDEMLE